MCQAEYRDGFTECSDCHFKLVASAAEAQSASARLWKGITQRKLNKILTALDSQNIPSRFKEIINAKPPITIFGIPIGPIRSTFEYEVWVFRSDLENARRAIENG
ncbi:MAG TPA: hypothetical protein VJN89_19830 [Candidatus Acidoferrum sp.]|nr:hypothetical protein [Candidatus Acidoferrum sp.]